MIFSFSDAFSSSNTMRIPIPTIRVKTVERIPCASYNTGIPRERSRKVKVEVRIDEAVTEPRIIILTNRMTDEVDALVRQFSKSEAGFIAGFRDGAVTILDENDVMRIYAANGKVYAVQADGEYLLRLRLYELEERLRYDRFVRISNSEIINLKKVKSFDLSLSGTICVVFNDGSNAYVSRRYVTKIKEVLGI